MQLYSITSLKGLQVSLQQVVRMSVVYAKVAKYMYVHMYIT